MLRDGMGSQAAEDKTVECLSVQLWSCVLADLQQGSPWVTHAVVLADTLAGCWVLTQLCSLAITGRLHASICNCEGVRWLHWLTPGGVDVDEPCSSASHVSG